jgi:hypothetical protein
MFFADAAVLTLSSGHAGDYLRLRWKSKQTGFKMTDVRKTAYSRIDQAKQCRVFSSV